MRLTTGLLLSFSLFAFLAWSDDEHHHALTEEEIGSVHFATSCAKTTEASFNQAVAMLHSFQYEDSGRAFDAISLQDPGCAIDGLNHRYSIAERCSTL